MPKYKINAIRRIGGVVVIEYGRGCATRFIRSIDVTNGAVIFSESAEEFINCFPGADQIQIGLSKDSLLRHSLLV